jgi:YesN/AraC family two-component response regulator
MYSLIIVDDEPVVREGLALHFPWEKYGFKVKEVFACPKKTLAFFTRDTADVLLTDIRMPQMSGLDLIRMIKETPDNTTLPCLISAYRDFAYAQEGMSLGVKYYLVKPTSFEEIGNTFQKIKQELDSRHPSPAKIPESILAEVKNNTIRQACAIMMAKPESCSLYSIARELDVDASHLSRLFKKETGENFRDRLLRIKMDQAAKMLVSPIHYSNRDISAALGYQDTQNFYRSFSRYYGSTPGEYRRRGSL